MAARRLSVITSRPTARAVLRCGQRVTASALANAVSAGTVNGRLWEFMGIAPTGRRATIAVIDIVRVRDGKVAEHWNVVDLLGVMQQLGAIPAQTEGQAAGTIGPLRLGRPHAQGLSAGTAPMAVDLRRTAGRGA